MKKCSFTPAPVFQRNFSSSLDQKRHYDNFRDAHTTSEVSQNKNL